MKKKWSEILFDVDDIIAFKNMPDSEKGLDGLNRYTYTNEPFFIINPLKERRYGSGAGSLTNIKHARNFLLEWDDGVSIKTQMQRAARYDIPFATATYSGGKSVHFILSLEEPMLDFEKYTNLSYLLQCAFGTDKSTTNPNRLSRVPGHIRDNGNEQELLDTKGRISYDDLVTWMNSHKLVRNKIAKARQEVASLEAMANRRREQSADIGAKNILPGIYRMMVEGGQLHPMTNSRHESLVKFATWLKANWHDQGEIEELLNKAADSMGISGRGDVEGIMRWMR